MAKSMKIEPFTMADKVIRAEVGDLEIEIDYDDVNHPSVRRDLKRLRKIVDANWNEDESPLSALRALWTVCENGQLINEDHPIREIIGKALRL